MNVH